MASDRESGQPTYHRRMGVTVNRVFVLTDAPADLASVEARLDSAGLSIVRPPQDPLLVTSFGAAWREGRWLVFDDDTGILAARIAAAYDDTTVLIVRVFDSDAGVLERHDAGDDRGSLIVPRGARRRAGRPVVDRELLDGLLIDGASSAEVERIAAASATFAEDPLEQLLALVGLRLELEVPTDALRLELSDGARLPAVADDAPPDLHVTGYASRMFRGIAGHSFEADLITVTNRGGPLQRLSITVGGAVVESGALAVDEVSCYLDNDHEGLVVVPIVDGRAELGLLDLRRAGRLAPELSTRQQAADGLNFRIRFRGRWLAPALGSVVLRFSDESDRSAAVHSVPDVVIDDGSSAPSRLPAFLPGPSHCLSGVELRTGEKLAVLRAHMVEDKDRLVPLAELVLRWAELVGRSDARVLNVHGLVRGVRSLKSAELGRGKKWTTFAAALVDNDNVDVHHDGFGAVSPSWRWSLYRWTRRHTRLLTVAFDGSVLGPVEAWNAATTLGDELAERGMVTQASVFGANRTLSYGLAYEMAVGLGGMESDPARWVGEPGPVMYLSNDLVAQLNPELIARTFEIAAVGTLVRLAAPPATHLRQLEAVLEPVLQPVPPAAPSQ